MLFLNTQDDFLEREREVCSFMSIVIFQDNACICIYYIRIHHTPKKHQQQKIHLTMSMHTFRHPGPAIRRTRYLV